MTKSGTAVGDHRLSSLTDDVVRAEDLLAQPRAKRLFIEARLGTDPKLELQAFKEQHIHGAVYAQIRDVFAAEPDERSGNLPLPELATLQRKLQAWGVDEHTEVVLYGPTPALAARGWWVLKWAGVRDVKVLDGGIRSWVNHGGAVAQGEGRSPLPPGAAALELAGNAMPQVLVEDVEALGSEVLLVDARDEPSFRAGCIPHAVNLPSSEQWTPSAALRSVDEIRSLYKAIGALGDRPVVIYCGGGVLSALAVLTLSSLRSRPGLFVGSWSQWMKCPQRMARSASTAVHR
jgi:thiosulfate/3-mercaptopyruvate sulfurtransferase